METIEEEVFTETKRDVSDVTDSCQGDNDPEPASVLSEADSPSELNENVISFAAMRSMSAGIGSWRSATSTSNWGMVCETFPQLNLLLGFLKVNVHLQHLSQFTWYVFNGIFVNLYGDLCSISLLNFCTQISRVGGLAQR